MDVISLVKIKDLIDEKVEEVMHQVEFDLEDSEEYKKIMEEIFELEQKSVNFFKFTNSEPTYLNEEDMALYRKFEQLNIELDRLGWKNMYIQGIKDSLSFIEKLINS